MNLNKVILAGNMTRDVEAKTIASGTTVAQFGLAINRKWKNAAGEAQEEVTFLDCEAWGKTAELIAQHFGKGKPIFVEGRLKLEQWDDKQSGAKRSKVKVVVESFQFVGAKGDAPAVKETGSVPRTAARTAPIEDDPFPF